MDANGFIVVRSTAHWYVNIFKLDQEEHANKYLQYKDDEIVLVAVLIAFKAADYIPGTGRIKMNQLISAYQRLESPLMVAIDTICRLEIQVICLSGFDFQPFASSDPILINS